MHYPSSLLIINKYSRLPIKSLNFQSMYILKFKSKQHNKSQFLTNPSEWKFTYLLNNMKRRKAYFQYLCTKNFPFSIQYFILNLNKDRNFLMVPAYKKWYAELFMLLAIFVTFHFDWTCYCFYAKAIFRNAVPIFLFPHFLT